MAIVSRCFEWIALGALLLVGGILRIYQLGAQSLWLDELFSVVVARGSWTQVLAGTIQGDTNPPLFNVFLHFALLFGSDETAARIVSLCFGIAAIPVFYAFVRDLFDIRVALVAVTLFVFSSFQIFYAQEARMYAQLAFFSVSAFFFFLRAWRNGIWNDWLFFALAMTLAFYTHSLAFLNLLALDIFVLTQGDVLRARWRSLVGAHIIIGILFAPWAMVMLQQIQRVQVGFWGAPPSVPVLFTMPYLFIFGNAMPLSLVPLALFVVVALLFFMGLAVVRAIRTHDPRSQELGLLVCVYLVPLVVLFLISLVRPMFVERTLIPASFGLYALLAWLIVQAKPRGLHIALGVLLLSSLGLALPNYYFNPDLSKPSMRQAAQALQAQYQPGDAIAHTSDSSALAFAYYAPQLPNAFLAGDPDYMTETTRGRSGRVAGLYPQELDAIVAEHSRVWLIAALDHNEDYQRARAQEFDVRFGEAQKSDIQGIALWLYQVKQ